MFADQHAANGVQLCLGAELAEITVDDRGRASGVRLANGTLIPADATATAAAAALHLRPERGSAAIDIAIFSYASVLYFGVTADVDSTPDVDVLTAGIKDALRELVNGCRATMLITATHGWTGAPDQRGSRVGARSRGRSDGRPNDAWSLRVSSAEPATPGTLRCRAHAFV